MAMHTENVTNDLKQLLTSSIKKHLRLTTNIIIAIMTAVIRILLLFTDPSINTKLELRSAVASLLEQFPEVQPRLEHHQKK